MAVDDGSQGEVHRDGPEPVHNATAAALIAAPFVGREIEMAGLRAARELAGSVRGRLLLVTGEPGIGKSRLMEEFSHDAAEIGWRVLFGRCWEEVGPRPISRGCRWCNRLVGSSSRWPRVRGRARRSRPQGGRLSVEWPGTIRRPSGFGSSERSRLDRIGLVDPLRPGSRRRGELGLADCAAVLRATLRSNQYSACAA
jgi:AAA ATPase domain